MPRNCDPNPENVMPCTVVSWVAKTEGIQVSIYGKAQNSVNNPWIGVGFSKAGLMTDADIYMCKKSGVTSASVFSYEEMPVLYNGVGIVDGTENSAQVLI